MKWDFFFLQNIGLVTRFHNRFSFFYPQSNLAVIDKFFAFNSPKQKEQWKLAVYAIYRDPFEVRKPKSMEFKKLSN